MEKNWNYAKPATFVSPVLRKRYSSKSNYSMSGVPKNCDSPSISPLRKRKVINFSIKGNKIIKKGDEDGAMEAGNKISNFGLKLKKVNDSEEGEEETCDLDKNSPDRAEEDEEEESAEYFLILKRPYFFSKERSRLKEIFCGEDYNHKIRPPLPFQNYSVREDKGCSQKYIRSTINSLYFNEDEGFNTQKIPLGFVITPFPVLLKEDSPIDLVDLENPIQKLRCTKCNAVPYNNTKAQKAIDLCHKGFYCKFCGTWKKITDEINSDLNHINIAKGIGSYEINYTVDHTKKKDFKNIILIFELKKDTLDYFSLLCDDYLADVLSQDFGDEIDLNFCIILAAQDRLFLVNGDIRATKHMKITEILDYNNKDFQELNSPKKSKGFFNMFDSKDKNSEWKESRFTVPEFEGNSYQLQNLTKDDWYNFFDSLKWENMIHHVGLESQLTSKICNLNAIEISSLMLKNLKNCHIINFAFNYSLEYIWGDSTMGMTDVEQKYKEIEDILLANSIVYESFVFRQSNLERHSKFCIITGGMCVNLFDYENDYNKGKILKSHLNYLLLSPIYYNVKLTVVFPKEVYWMKWHTLLNRDMNSSTIRLSCMRQNSSLSLVYNLGSWDEKKILKVQFQLEYFNSTGFEKTRVFNKCIKPSRSAHDYYETLDSFAIGLIILRKYMSYWREYSVKRVGNKMLDFFEDILNRYYCVVYELKSEDSPMADAKLFDDMTLPESLDNTLMMLYSSVKKKLFKSKPGSKGGIVYKELLKLFRASPLEIQSWFYPRITAIKDLIEDKWNEMEINKSTGVIETPANLICTIEDMKEQTYFADLGDYYLIFYFEKIFIEKEQDDKEGQADVEEKLEFIVVEDPEVELNKEQYKCVKNFAGYWNSLRTHIPKPYIFEKVYEEDVLEYPMKEDLIIEDQGCNILSLEQFKDYLDNKIDGREDDSD